jgi:hypothetical protein
VGGSADLEQNVSKFAHLEYDFIFGVNPKNSLF